MFLSWGDGDAEQSRTDGRREEGDPSGLFDRNLYDVHGSCCLDLQVDLQLLRLVHRNMEAIKVKVER